MMITDVQFKMASFTLIHPIKVAFGEVSDFQTILLKMETDEGICGYGEASPFAYVTGDSIETSLAVGKELRQLLIGKNPIEIERLHELMDGLYAHNSAIKAAFDIAAYDIAAKKAGVPLYQYLGGYKKTLELDSTIGIDEPEEMARISREWVDKGFGILKIKLGENPARDVLRMAAIRKAVGEQIILRVDANQGWTVKDAISTIRALEAYHVELIEQPVAYWDLEGLREVRENVATPVFADESCHDPVDAALLAKNRAVDGMNIKLMKCDGLFKAQQINAIAQASGITCMVGCMGESRVGNLAGMHFAAAHKNVTIADLDTVFGIHCEWMKGGFVGDGHRIELTDEPGLGVTIEGF